MKRKKFNDFLITCGGTTLHSFEKANVNDQQKRKNAGIVVFVISCVSGLVAGSAWAVPLGWPGYLIAPLWTVIMLLLERAILQQMDAAAISAVVKLWMENKDPSVGDRAKIGIGFLLLRFLMIFFISYFNSEMVRVILFKPEIVAEIKSRQDKDVSKIIDSISVLRDSAQMRFDQKEFSFSRTKSLLDQKIRDCDDSIAQITSDHVYEVSGRGGITHRAGNGSVAKSMEEAIERFKELKASLIRQSSVSKDTSGQVSALGLAQQERNDARILLGQKNAELDSVQEKIVKRYLDRPVNGLSFMLSVLNDLASRDWLIWTVFAMFFFIEAIPVLIKFTSKIDSFIFERANESIEMIADQNERAAKSVSRIHSLRRRNP